MSDPHEPVSVRRRHFVTSLAGLTAAGVAGVRGTEAFPASFTSKATQTAQAEIGQLLFSSTSGLLAPDRDPLTDDSLVAVYAEPTAEVRDRDGDGDAVSYPDGVDIPLVGVDERGDGAVAGVGAMLVNDGDLVPELEGEDPLGDLGNEEFLLNLYDEYASGDTVLWDESHGQFYSLDRFRNFEAYAEENGYDLEPTGDLTADLDEAGAVVITSPSDGFTDAELDALDSFVADGGLVVLHDQSDFSNFDRTDTLNEVADGLGLGFRFNDGEVGDTENNVGIGYLPLTSNFNDDFPLFADRPGITIELRRGRDYDVDIVDVADGDTFDVVFDGDDIGLETDYTATVRVLGIDTPESASVAASAERPEEWEGLAYDIGEPDPIDELVFDSTASLLDASKEPLTDDSLVAVYAEPTASNEDSDGNGDAVFYPEDTDIPLVAVDGNVAGLGAPFVDDGFDATADNEEFLVNLYDQLVGGGTVLWDEGHGQFYDLASFPEFESYAEENGYSLEATTDLIGDLSGADAIVITSPSAAFTSDELDALGSFVAGGGAVFLHDQSDFNDFDATANLNAIADALGLGFRFNDDQVVDSDNNGGRFFIPATGNFAGPDALFETRVGIDEDPDARTTPYLIERANVASEFARDALDGENATVFFDENEPLRDPTRLLMYAEYDADGDGERETLYNRQIIEEGYGRAYGSGLSRHDEFRAAEQAARGDNRGVWDESDISEASPYREGDIDELFLPEAAVLDHARGRPRPQSVAVYSEPDATIGRRNSKKKLPLFGVDSHARVAVGGSLLIDESYERLEGFEADTSGFDNFPFLSEIIGNLTENEDDTVFIDGGHGQFGAEYALSNEDAAYYQRHLEGRGITFEQINDVTLDRLSGARALIVTTPVTDFTPEEVAAVRSFRDDGGAVVLLGSGSAPTEATDNLNALAGDLDTGLRVGQETVTDSVNNVGGLPNLPTVTDIDVGPEPPRPPGRGKGRGRGPNGR
jgi:endonuclease YncB( thermonuclease family)